MKTKKYSKISLRNNSFNKETGGSNKRKEKKQNVSMSWKSRNKYNKKKEDGGIESWKGKEKKKKIARQGNLEKKKGVETSRRERTITHERAAGEITRAEISRLAKKKALLMLNSYSLILILNWI